MAEHPLTIRLHYDAKLLTEPNNSPFVQADFVAVSKLSGTYAVSFYQFDYQSMMAVPADAPDPISVNSICIAKITMDQDGFVRMLYELKRIADKTGAPWPTSEAVPSAGTDQ